MNYLWKVYTLLCAIIDAYNGGKINPYIIENWDAATELSCIRDAKDSLSSLRWSIVELVISIVILFALICVTFVPIAALRPFYSETFAFIMFALILSVAAWIPSIFFTAAAECADSLHVKNALEFWGLYEMILAHLPPRHLHDMDEHEVVALGAHLVGVHSLDYKLPTLKPAEVKKALCLMLFGTEELSEEMAFELQTKTQKASLFMCGYHHSSVPATSRPV